MAGTSVLKLKVDDQEYNSSLRQAQQGMLHLEQALQAAGKTFNQVDKSVVEYARAIGQMETQSKTARGRIGEMSSAFIELSTQYNKMSADVQNSDVGKALSQSMDELRQRTVAAKQELEDLNRQLSNTKTPDIGSTSDGFLSGLGDKMGGALQVFGGNLMTKGAMMIGNFAAEMGDMVKQGIEMAKAGEGIRIAFERLGRGDLLDGLREATHGTVTDLELMKAAVKFNDFKLPVEELGTMLAFAQQKAKDTGQSVDYMVDSIVTGLGRKSLMILDNLGLSAAEIKEKMAQTGDMTKAVGEIIREQMSKAGEYVKTAADEATEADVRLKNAMTDLGDALKPLTSSFNTFWTDIKVGGLNFMKEVLAPMLNQLTEAGRIANAMNAAGGNNKINGQLAALSGADDKQSAYTSQISRYNSEIKRLEVLIGEADKLSPMQRGSEFVRKQLQEYAEQIKVLQQMKALYMKGAESILNPVAAVTGGTGGGGAGGTGGKNSATDKATYIPAIGSIDEMTAKVKELQDALNQTGDQTVRGILLVQLQRANEELDRMKGKGLDLLSRDDSSSLVEKLGLSSYDYGKKNMKLPETKVTTPSVSEDDMPELEKLNATMSKFNGGVGSIVAGLKSMGIDLGEDVNRVLSAVSGVTQIISGVSSVIELFSTSSQTANTIALTANTTAIAALTAAVSTNTITSFLPFFAGGGVVRAAGGFEVPGNHFSGDMVPALLNSGEVVFNRAQVGVLGSSLQQQAANNRQVLVTKVKGTDLLVMLDQTGKLTGKGELMFWR